VLTLLPVQLHARIRKGALQAFDSARGRLVASWKLRGPFPTVAIVREKATGYC